MPGGVVEPYGEGNGSFVKLFTGEDQIQTAPGDEVARFKLGSTVVLVFEAERFQFDVEVGQRVKVGQALGRHVKNHSVSHETS